MPPSKNDRYGIASAIYDAATALWSGGAIWQTRERTLGSQPEGAADVLVPGPGTGRLAVLAASRGARVTAVELSPSMLRRTQRRAARAGVRLQLIHGGLTALAPGAQFDLVVCEHFLNVFAPEEMRRVRDRMISHVRIGGTFAIADFTPIDGASSAPLRALQRIHHVTPLFGCAMLTRNSMHSIYDHESDLAGRADLELVDRWDAKSYRYGPGWFRTWAFRRVAPAEVSP